LPLVGIATWLLARQLAVARQLAGEELGQQRIPDYETALGIFWRELYPQGGETLYCGEAFESDSGGRVRGEIARAMLFRHQTHGLAIFTRLNTSLKRWNRADLPSAEGHRRNDSIELLQGNRNPFIEAPRLAERPWF
jgi:hypothetical protein